MCCACSTADKETTEAKPSETTETPPEVYQGQSPRAEPPANVVGGFSIQLPERTLAPGEERFPCFVFPLQVNGPSLIVGGGKLTTTKGMHHGNITSRPITDGEGIRPCPDDNAGAFGGEAADILAGGAVLFGSSTQIEGEEWQSFPDGMGYPIAEGYEIVARMHYLNTTNEELTLAPSYEWFTIDEALVDKVLGPFAWAMSDFVIPPLSTHTVEATCTPLRDMHLVNVLPHMHALGTEFFGTYVGGELDGERWLDSQGYDPEGGVLTQYTPAIDLSIADAVTFGCTWENTFDKPIVNGVGDNEMCILFGYAWPYENSYSAAATETGCAMVTAPPPGN